MHNAHSCQLNSEILQQTPTSLCLPLALSLQMCVLSHAESAEVTISSTYNYDDVILDSISGLRVWDLG